MEQSKRLTSKRVNGIKEGYWTTCKKDEITQRLGEYEDTGFSPEEIKSIKSTENLDEAKFGEFLNEIKEALKEYEKNCINPPSYTGKMCFIMEVLTITADNPIKELVFTAGNIKRALNLAKEKNA